MLKPWYEVYDRDIVNLPQATLQYIHDRMLVFDLIPGGASRISAAALNNPYVDGYKFGARWKDLENPEGTFHWDKLDAFVAQVQATGKLMQICIAMSGTAQSSPSGGDVPDWVFTALGSQTISYIDKNQYHPTYNQAVAVPLPFSDVWVTKRANMIAKVGARYANTPNVIIAEGVTITVMNNDWSMAYGNAVDGIPPAGSTVNSRLRDAGYSHNAMVNAGVNMLKAFADAWPKQVIYMATGPIGGGLETDPLSVARDIRDGARTYAGPSRIVIGNDGISNKMPFALDAPSTSDWYILEESAPYVGGQALWNCFGDTTYRMNGGSSNGMTDSEILMASADKLQSYFGTAQPESIDTQNNLWVGSEYGLRKFVAGNNSTFTHYDTSNSPLPSALILDIESDPSGGVWIGTAAGLVRFDGINWMIYNQANTGMPGKVVSDVARRASDGLIAIANYNPDAYPYTGGVSTFDGTTWTHYTPDNSPLTHWKVVGVEFDPDGNLWAWLVQKPKHWYYQISVHTEKGVPGPVSLGAPKTR